jgi:wyosine [tRNA(Phe)-imidazoG37] synthetase (radical SAM superfamily)
MATREELQRLHPREYAGFTYAYPVLSRRSGGVSFGVNLNLDKACNFDCPYCQVDRTVPGRPKAIDVARIQAEVRALLDSVDDQGVCRLPLFDGVADADKKLRDIAVSGDGEPTMVPEFADVCRALAGAQAERPDLDFKLVLISNATLLDRPAVRAGIDALLGENGKGRGEVWAKLDAGTEAWYQRVNVSRVSLDRIEANLVSLGKDHPFKVQSFFCEAGGKGWDEAEAAAWLDRLARVRASGARLLEVQLYTLARRPAEAFVKPVTAAFLDAMRARVEALGIPAKVYGVGE